MGVYSDHVLPRVIDVACNNKEAKKQRERVCDGLAPQYLIFNVGTNNSRKRVYGADSQVKVDWVRVWAPRRG